jgi:hypothetical protein
MPRHLEAILDREMRRWDYERTHPNGAATDSRAARTESPPILTVAREHGTHGVEIAARIAEHRGWTLVHQDAIERIGANTGFKQRLLEALERRSHSGIRQWIDSMLSGRIVDESDFAYGLLLTVRSLAGLGGVVIVGHGANFVVGPGAGLHVRIVAPRAYRVARLRERLGVDAARAARGLDEVDEGRDAFIRRLCHRDAADPLGYDLVLNEATLGVPAIVETVNDLAEVRFGPPRRVQVNGSSRVATGA